MTIPKKSAGSFHNEGVYGNVHAKNIAIGRGATAVFNEGDRTALDGHLDQLTNAIASLSLPAGARKQLETDTAKLKEAATAPEPDKEKVGGILETISGKLKMLGEATKGTSEIVETLVKIAGFFHLSAGVLGLF